MPPALAEPLLDTPRRQERLIVGGHTVKFQDKNTPEGALDSGIQRYRKKHIPKALREAVWLAYSGRTFSHKCFTSWCPNVITVFDFQTGHNIPESKGGKTSIDNLIPLCARCNSSMGDHYTFTEWSTLFQAAKRPSLYRRFIACFKRSTTVMPAPVELPTKSSTHELPATGKSPASPAS